MKKICFIGIASALILAGCSDEINPANQGNQEELTENSAFLKIRISDVMTGSQTKATAGDFEVSTSEHDVANADFYFYDQAGTFVTKANVWADGQNVSEENGNVEFNGNTVVVLKGLTQKNFPEYLVTVLNGDGRYGQTLNEMEALLSTTDETATDGGFKAGENFIMTTSSYVHSDGTPYFVTKLEEGNFAKDPGNIEKPVTVYVERLAAKVRLSFTENASGAKNPLVPVTIEGLKNTYKMNVTIAGDDNKDEENTEDENPSHIGSEEIVLHFTGWNLNATARKSRLMKNIDTEWAGSKFNFEMSWTDEGNHRSYWGKSYNYDIASYTYPKQGEAALASDALHYVNANEVKEIEEAIYCAENTNTSEIVSANPASAITSAVLYAEVLDGNGKALNLVRFSGLFYEESQYITYVLGNLKKTGKFEYYTKGNTDESGTHYDPVTPADAQIVNIGNGNVNVQLTFAEGTELYDKEGNVITDGLKNANKALADFNATNKAIAYKGGKMYYNVPIEHYNNDEIADSKIPEAKYGIVRNHVYVLNITSLSNLGKGIFDADEVIVPDDPIKEKELYQVGANIKVLSWKVVNQNVEL
ncbi:MAG: Mfa1 fimbrilin C-terminal domain-containing protein [Bacteroidales bacterium]|nr:Mfa1 fimbrilin C-terminal domain-containing protein [Bacteroidales bacterium]